MNGNLKTRILTADQVLDAAIAAERGTPANLDLARFIHAHVPSSARLILVCARIARRAGSPATHVDELRAWVEKHESERDFLIALHREMLSLRDSSLDLYDGVPDALP